MRTHKSQCGIKVVPSTLLSSSNIHVARTRKNGMNERAIMCSICRVLMTNHAYGKPLPQDVVLNKASFPAHDGTTAKAAFDRLRRKSFIVNYGTRGIQLDNSQFASLIQFLYDECDWERFELELRIKHFEGWDEIQW
jgi:hypothetical protein